MSKINLLDCTLREAPIKDLILGSDYIQKFINALEKSNIDITAKITLFSGTQKILSDI